MWLIIYSEKYSTIFLSLFNIGVKLLVKQRSYMALIEKKKKNPDIASLEDKFSME